MPSDRTGLTMWDRDKVALIVDDEVFARLFAAQILMDEGYLILEAENAEDGLDALERNDDVAIVIADIEMPGELNGIGLARKVRDRYPEVGVILASGRVRPPEEELDCAAAFLAKPFTAAALMDAIRASSLDKDRP